MLRDGQPREIPLAQIVPGDVVKLAAGDMIPADLRVVACKDLFVIQSSLTGESLPVEKFDAPDENGGQAVADMKNVCFLGTSVESGTATAVVVETGFRTYLGSMAKAIIAQQLPTSFDRGVSQFTWLMIYFMRSWCPLVFLINGLTKGTTGGRGAFFFALAVAVGLTPEMLPMIVTVCLSRGAIGMSRKKVIVKRLNSIQNLGAMDVLCTDKTGTLDRGPRDPRTALRRGAARGRRGAAVGLLQQPLPDRAEERARPGDPAAPRRSTTQFKVPEYQKVDEIPFDFSRRVMSVVVKTPEGRHRLICKGAPEAIFQRCNRFELDGKIYPMDPLLIRTCKEEHDSLSADGFRVLALAYKDVGASRTAYSQGRRAGLDPQGLRGLSRPAQGDRRARPSRP